MEWNYRQYAVFILAKWALFDSLIVKKASSSRLSWKEINWKIKDRVLSDSRLKSVYVFIERGFFDNIGIICKKMRLFSVCICPVILASFGCADFSVLWSQGLCAAVTSFISVLFSSANYLNHRWNWQCHSTVTGNPKKNLWFAFLLHIQVSKTKYYLFSSYYFK